MQATFSPCGTFRHMLQDVWDPTLPLAVWCLMNPSIAGCRDDWTGAIQTDPTWRKGVGFSKRLGYGGQVFVNLSDYVATNVADLRNVGYPMSATNDAHILAGAAMGDGSVICAWGALARGWPRAAEVTAVLRRAGFTLRCLGFTALGEPRHPLMLAYRTPLEDYHG